MFRLRCLFSRIDRVNAIPMRSIRNSANSIQYRAATADDLDPMVDMFLTQFFRDQPLSSNVKMEFQRDDAEEYVMSLISHGGSIVATDSLQNDKIVAIKLTGPTDPSTAEKYAEEAKRWESKWKYWSDVSKLLTYFEKRANVWERFNITKSLHSHIGVVDRSMRGKSISDGVNEKFEELAKSLGYPAISCDCTNFYSARNNGKTMQSVYGLAFVDYKDSSGKQIFKPSPPHSHIRKFLKLL